MAKILIVDDRPTNRQFLLTLLGYSEHRLLEAADGAQALEIVRAERPDLVITDILMPTMDGYEFVQQLRADPALAATKIIFYSATYSVLDAKKLGASCGVTDILSKPSEPQAIFDVVNRVLGITDPTSPIPEAMRNTGMDDIHELNRIGGRFAEYLDDIESVRQVLNDVAGRGKKLTAEREGLRQLSERFSDKMVGLQRVTSRLSALEEMSLRLMGERKRERLGEIFLGASSRIIGAQYAAICMFDPRERDAELLLAREFDAGILRGAALDRARLPGSLLEAEQPRRIASMAGGGRELPAGHPPVENFLGMRIIGSAQVLGWVYFAGKAGADEFSREDENFALTMATQLALLYENATLYYVVQHRAAELQVEMTERKRAEERLLKLSQAVEQSPAATVITDTDGRIEYVNPRVSEITGFTPEDLVGKTPALIKSGLTPLHVYQDLWRTIKSGEVWRGEMQNRRKNGELYWEYEIISSVKNEHGEIVNFIAVKVDVSERKRAEEEILALSANLERRVAERTLQLEEANRAKSDFLANMSHELRTPLNSIIGFSELLKDGVLGELEAKQRGFVADIFDAGSHLLLLINDILDLSKVEAGMLQLEAGAVDVAALLKASMLIVREKAATHRIRLDTQLDPALGAMLADERKLKQIVYNLLSNAVKFTPDGGTVTLSARRCARAEVAFDEALPARLIALPPGEDGGFLAITVEDTGVGIPEEHLPKLFERFTQLDSSASRSHGGTGLGLSLVRRLAELHGGTVGVASRPGVGSRFCVWLPWREAASASALPKRAGD